MHTLSHNVMYAQGESVREELSCEVYLSTPPVGYSGSLSTVNQTNCNEKRCEQFFQKYELTSNSIQTCPDTMCLKMNAIVVVDLNGGALQLVLLVRGVDDFFVLTAALKSDRSFIGPFLPALFKVRYHCPWYLFFSSGVRRYVWSSCAISSHSLHFCSVHPIASCDSR